MVVSLLLGLLLGGLSGYYGGTIDEARIEREARSADWVRAQYLSMTDQLVIFGAEEIGP